MTWYKQIKVASFFWKLRPQLDTKIKEAIDALGLDEEWRGSLNEYEKSEDMGVCHAVEEVVREFLDTQVPPEQQSKDLRDEIVDYVIDMYGCNPLPDVKRQVKNAPTSEELAEQWKQPAIEPKRDKPYIPSAQDLMNDFNAPPYQKPQ